MKRLILAFLGLSVALTGCKTKAPAAESGGEEAPKPVVQVALISAHLKNLSQTISIEGIVSPLANRESKVAPISPGRVRSLNVKVGQVVAKGQVLAVLDAGPLSGQVQQAAATVRSDEAALKQAQINYESQILAQNAAVEQADQNLRAQRVALNKVLAGARPQEVAQAQAAVVSAQAALTAADQNLSRSQTLFAEGLLARKDLETAHSQQVSAAAQLKTAQEALSLVVAGSRSQDIQSARIAVDQAEAQLRAARNSAIQNRAKAQDVQIAKRALDNAQGALASARAQLSGLTIRAPLGGVVVARPLNIGEWVDTAGSVATIADLSTVRLLLQVPATQIGAVHLDQEVQFSSDSSPRRDRRALVTVIGKATDPATNTVLVEAEASNRDLSLRDDSFVHGKIVLSVHPNALVVPSTALVQKDDGVVVYVVGADNIAHAKKVQVLLQEGGDSEVSGLENGAKVVTTGAYELDDGTKVETGK